VDVGGIEGGGIEGGGIEAGGRVDDEPAPADGAAEEPEPVVGPVAASRVSGAVGDAADGDPAVGAGPTAGAPADPRVARPLRSRYGSPGLPTAGRLVVVVAESAGAELMSVSESV
jgi:hypothetical protein